jgi:hypothetical protein
VPRASSTEAFFRLAGWRTVGQQPQRKPDQLAREAEEAKTQAQAARQDEPWNQVTLRNLRVVRQRQQELLGCDSSCRTVLKSVLTQLWCNPRVLKAPIFASARACGHQALARTPSEGSTRHTYDLAGSLGRGANLERDVW